MRKMSKGDKLTYADVKKAIKFICENNLSQEELLITHREIQGVLKYKYEKDFTHQTIRDRGVSHRGYFQKKYPKAIDYNKKGSNENRGLIVKPEKYLEQVNV